MNDDSRWDVDTTKKSILSVSDFEKKIDQYKQWLDQRDGTIIRLADERNALRKQVSDLADRLAEQGPANPYEDEYMDLGEGVKWLKPRGEMWHEFWRPHLGALMRGTEGNYCDE